MTNRERVIASLEHEQPDRVPYCVSFTQKARKKMAAYYGDPNFASKLGNALTAVSSGLPDGWQEIAPDLWQDEFGVKWDRSIDKDIGVVCNQMIRDGALDDYTFPDPHDPSRYALCPTTEQEKGGQFFLVDLGFSLFERAWTLYGMENLLLRMMTAPDFVNELLDRILEHNLGRIERACSFDIDGMLFGDDWGSQRGLIMGPDRWREFIGPRVREMYQAVRKRGKYVFIHSCGKVDELFPDLIECGLHCFNPFQPEVMDPLEMKRMHGDRLSFFGGISTQRTLPYGTVQDTRDEVRHLLDEVGRNGGYIAAPSHAVPGDAKAENIAAMIEVLQEQ